MIDFNKQMIRFLNMSSALNISSNAQVFYVQLLNQFRLKCMPRTASFSNLDLRRLTGLSRAQFFNAREELTNSSLIQCESIGGSASPIYTLISLLQVNEHALIQNVSELRAMSTGITNLKLIKEQIDNMPKRDERERMYYILDTIEHAVKLGQNGVYGQKYITSQKLLQVLNLITYNDLFNLSITLTYKQDITNLKSYIIACLVNNVGVLTEREKKKQAIKIAINEFEGKKHAIVNI